MTKVRNFAEAKAAIKDLLPEYLQRAGINPRAKFRCLSPEHQDNSPSMSYWPKANICKCWACDAKMDTLDIIQADYHCSFREAVDIGCRLFGITIDETAQAYEPVTIVSHAVPDQVLDTGLDLTEEVAAAREALKQYPQALEYLKSRGISQETIDKCQIGFSPAGYNAFFKKHPELQTKSRKEAFYTYTFPYFDASGVPVYALFEIYTRMQIDEYNGKYRKITGVPTPLFNERYIRSDKETPPVVFVTEGIYDALSIEEVGGQAIALQGVGQTRFLALCKNYSPETTFVLCLDNDNAGEKGIERISNGLTELGIDFIVHKAENEKDVNEQLISDRKSLEQMVSSIVEGITAQKEQEEIEQ